MLEHSRPVRYLRVVHRVQTKSIGTREYGGRSIPLGVPLSMVCIMIRRLTSLLASGEGLTQRRRPSRCGAYRICARDLSRAHGAQRTV